jgi:hypothetical protein
MAEYVISALCISSALSSEYDPISRLEGGEAMARYRRPHPSMLKEVATGTASGLKRLETTRKMLVSSSA